MAKEYLIGPEDVLDVLVWKNCPDLCRTVPVRPDGKVSQACLASGVCKVYRDQWVQKDL